MHWLLLPIAALALLLALRTTSSGLMLLWFAVMVAAISGWLWLRYKLLFPPRDTNVEMTPLDPVELARLRSQAQTNREQEAAAQAAAEADAFHPIHPVAPTAIATPVYAAPPPTAPIERPLTGRAVFILPDDDLPPVAPNGERPA